MLVIYEWTGPVSGKGVQFHLSYFPCLCESNLTRKSTGPYFSLVEETRSKATFSLNVTPSKVQF